ncbi:PAS domain-containing sensor histidine kinase, partial [Escherichia coli]|nr:PAS domain-containing sensor histidine kinase [Escherichia coli]
MSAPESDTIWSALPVAGFILDRNNCIERMNPAAEEFLSASLRTIQGAPVWE